MELNFYETQLLRHASPGVRATVVVLEAGRAFEQRQIRCDLLV